VVEQGRWSRPTGGGEEPALRVPRAEATRLIKESIQVGKDLLDRRIESRQAFDAFRSDFDAWHKYNGTLLLKLFTTVEIQDQYHPSVFSAMSSSLNPQQRIQGVRDDIQRELDLITSILARLDSYEEIGRVPLAMQDAGSRPGRATVFVVHGANGERKHEVARFIERVTGSWPTILHEQTNLGRTIIEKFENLAGETRFAVVLLTADDVGGVDANSLKPRARQNVVLELGFFMAHLGRARVVALCEEGVERPSDIDGVLYIQLAGGWQLQLAQEMKAASIDVDLNKVLV
jgi:predicted nucleotide-binding protein